MLSDAARVLGGQLLGKRRVLRVEVVAVPLHAAGGGVQVHAHALAKAQLASVLPRWHGKTGVQQHEAGVVRVELAVITVGVIEFGDITGRPGHGNSTVKVNDRAFLP